ncbi:hypothetical protein [Dolichospermum sp. FACHB-1091]|nr:hypothetical protein [Dolichospermum sp. FACHB-1091]
MLQTKPTACPEIITQRQGITENIVFETYQDELLPPKEIEF